jgi:ubiquinone/menaquinone biosynthesis C-methylase UbiE
MIPPEPQIDIYDPVFVKGVFDRCSEKYILFSLVCSFGFTERWRKQCVATMPAISKGAIGYDLMAGTGEVWPHLLKRFQDIKHIVAIDISAGMHRLALDRLHRGHLDRIQFVEDNVLDSKLPENTADFIVSTFGLKTFNAAQQAALATLVSRLLKPGGSFALIEASDPKGWWFRPLYLLYLKRILPLVERLFLNGAQDFTMIGEYTSNFRDASAMGRELASAGLDVIFRRHFFGCATSVSGKKPV